MVASSGRALRTREADHNPSLNSLLDDDARPKAALSTARPKRLRVPSISARDAIHKKRKLAPKPEIDELQIPLRSKEVKLDPDSITTRPLLPIDPVTTSSSNSPLQSPAIRSQYDQIRRIEEKARKAIQSSQNSDGRDDRRRLRSEHGGSRAKTELSQYFPNFDEMLSLEPPDPDTLTARTKIILADDAPSFELTPGRADPFGATKPLHDVTYLDLNSLASTPGYTIHDPLSPDIYYKAHRKAERHEKQMKNGDKERAQHEKYQLDRLLDELRGPDWLKTLGISGITDTEKKRYEPKRALFIRETKALIEKFRRWKEEEKRRKVERDQLLLEEAAEMEGEAEENANADADAEASTSTRKNKRRPRSRAVSPPHPPSTASSDKGPDSSEIDDLASQQLLQEAKTAAVMRKKKASLPEPPAPPPPPPQINKPLTSFFEKRHIRDAAVAGRQRGRTVMAFGQAVPEFEDEEFTLSRDMLTEDAIRASQRNRRRARRSTDD